MRLYHGSNVEVREPRILPSNRALDFGAGFYTTSSEAQATRWSRAKTARQRSGAPTVTVFDLDESALGDLHVLRFDRPDGAWLDFVCANRRNAYRGQQYDLVVGPVANDNTMPVISAHMAGTIDRETAIILLKPQKLSDQYAFLTSKALGALVFEEVRKDG